MRIDLAAYFKEECTYWRVSDNCRTRRQLQLRLTLSRYLSPIRVAEQLRVVEKSKCLPNSAHNRSYSHHHHAPCNSRLPLVRRYRLPSLLHH